MARNCRPTPAGLRPRSKVRSARARSRASSSGKWPTRSTFQVCAKRTKYSSLVVGGAAISTAVASRVGAGILGLPVVDMIEVSERTRCGNEIAISWAIMPPHRHAHQMSRLDAERVQQAGRILRHVVNFIGRGDRDFQEAQLEQLDRGQALAAREVARLADVAVVEADHAKPARGKLPAEIVV